MLVLLHSTFEPGIIAQARTVGFYAAHTCQPRQDREVATVRESLRVS